jgi:hypothetical protein
MMMSSFGDLVRFIISVSPIVNKSSMRTPDTNRRSARVHFTFPLVFAALHSL